MTDAELTALANTAEIVRIVPHELTVYVDRAKGPEREDVRVGLSDLPEDIRTLCEAVPRLVAALRQARKAGEVLR